MNPNSKIMALKAAVPGVTGDNLQVSAQVQGTPPLSKPPSGGIFACICSVQTDGCFRIAH